MRRFKHKISKQRGTRHVGRGKNKRGRGKGSRMTSKRVFGPNRQHYWKYEPERFNIKGFVPPKSVPADRTINLDDIDRIAGKSGEFDAAAQGYGRVLGGGKLARPITIKAFSFSEGAVKKIEAAGGKAVKLE